MQIRFTANLMGNLASIEDFFDANQHPHGYESLLDELEARVLPNLLRHPRMGRHFLARRPWSVEAQRLHEAIQARLAAGDQVREYVLDSHLLLYRVNDHVIDLLAIRHHKQLAFDMQDFLSGAD